MSENDEISGPVSESGSESDSEVAPAKMRSTVRMVSPSEQQQRRRQRSSSPEEGEVHRDDHSRSPPRQQRPRRPRSNSGNDSAEGHNDHNRRRDEGREPSKLEILAAETPEQKLEKAKKLQKQQLDELLTTKTGGAYIPPAKLRMMQEAITDKASASYQRLAWEALKKSINGLINKVNSPNIAIIVRELFSENIVRGRGLLCQSIMTAQTASPTFTHVYAGLVSIINTKFPNIGELLLKRLILNFRRGFKRNDKTRCMSSTRFIAHLVNQQVVHELLSLEILTLLLDTPTDDSVEVSISFLKECGSKLSEVSPRGINAIFESLRTVLHESNLDKRTQYMIEVMFQVRKDGFKDNPAVLEELDLVEEEDQFTHTVPLVDEDKRTDGEEVLLKNDDNYFIPRALRVL